jgi:NAD(P)-dependent dehydrogenase (short-subunit alcohol dehydrogenase family)
MVSSSKTAILISISSDIGLALADRWLDREWRLIGSYRTRPDQADQLEKRGVRLIECDVADPDSVDRFASKVSSAWDVLVLLPAMLGPVGTFETCDIDEWERSIYLNFTAQLRLVRRMLPTRNKETKNSPCVIFFNGGGTNSAPVNYSAYTVSKIALTKMCELLDAEMSDTRFTIIGPGWVDTKIHQATFEAGELAGANLARTREVHDKGRFTPMEKVVDCCNWAIEAPREVMSGRNISVVHDAWGEEDLDTLLRAEPDVYKLRRAGNDRLVRR